jgi:hypothetical protein
MATGFRLAGTACLALVGLAPAAGAALAQQPMPPAVVTVSNARASALISFEIATSAEPRRVVAKLARPLAPGGTAGLRLARPAGCSYIVTAHFEDTTYTDAASMDLCKDKIIRLTD